MVTPRALLSSTFAAECGFHVLREAFDRAGFRETGQAFDEHVAVAE